MSPQMHPHATETHLKQQKEMPSPMYDAMHGRRNISMEYLEETRKKVRFASPVALCRNYTWTEPSSTPHQTKMKGKARNHTVLSRTRRHRGRSSNGCDQKQPIR